MAVRAAFNGRLGPDPHSDFMLREVEQRMLERLDLIKLDPVNQVLDVGCGLGQSLAKLAVHYPGARMIGIDLADRVLAQAAGNPDSRSSRTASAAGAAGVRSMLSRLGLAGSRPPPATMPLWVAGDAHALPFAANSIDMVWSNLAAHWFDDPIAAVAEWHRVIRPDGLLMFSAFGVDTLKEVRAGGAREPTATAEVGWPSFQDMHDWGDALTSAGFADPVMDAERLTLTYEDPDKYLQEARGLALQSGLRLPATLPPLVLSIELIYGHAWCPAIKRRSDGLATVQFHRAGSKL